MGAGLNFQSSARLCRLSHIFDKPNSSNPQKLHAGACCMSGPSAKSVTSTSSMIDLAIQPRAVPPARGVSFVEHVLTPLVELGGPRECLVMRSSNPSPSLVPSMASLVPCYHFETGRQVRRIVAST